MEVWSYSLCGRFLKQVSEPASLLRILRVPDTSEYLKSHKEVKIPKYYCRTEYLGKTKQNKNKKPQTKPKTQKKTPTSAETKPFKYRNFAKTGDSQEQEALVHHICQKSASDQALTKLPAERQSKWDEERRGMVYALHLLFFKPKPQTGNVSLEKFCDNVCFSHVQGEFCRSLQ